MLKIRQNHGAQKKHSLTNRRFQDKTRLLIDDFTLTYSWCPIEGTCDRVIMKELSQLCCRVQDEMSDRTHGINTATEGATLLAIDLIPAPPEGATCYGGACVGEWSTETTKYKTLNFKEDSYVHVSCRYSHLKVEGEEETIKCVGGQLPTYLPQCVLRKESCSPLKAPVFGSMKCSTTALEVGSSCTFECQSTHYLRGTSTRICTEGRRWTGSLARCLMKSECSEPPPLHQGTVTGCSPYRKPRYNDTCYFRCNEGFRLVGPSYLKCRLDGRLTDEKGHQRFPRCETSVPINSSVGATPGKTDFQNKPRPVSPTSWLSCQVHNGYCSHYCHQEPKGIRCSCRSGYRLSNDGKTCIETFSVYPYPNVAVTPVDEDFRNTPRPVSPPSWLSCQLHKGYCSHHCHQEPEGVRCSCRSGYRLYQNGRTCTDVDECQNESLNKCDHLCRNTVGSFKCLCRQGYTSPDGFRCESRGGLVVRSRLWGRRVPGAKPDSTEDPPCMGLVAR
ncbi:Signal peptide, CUB and EGF-like domain-containing protein 2 [Araneus ventricosus]|uniref:Signal peptide, CUB and EGF-like domain-containing protein 2 n=1 Tax=Araneus ventricosus TaxID=182803 RepID=A0A4Y2QB95_ARAVE|nr:Signal peptide, CUB and EGF-like domain-containing protein 2 [Araneus ventricosus]